MEDLFCLSVKVFPTTNLWSFLFLIGDFEFFRRTYLLIFHVWGTALQIWDTESLSPLLKWVKLQYFKDIFVSNIFIPQDNSLNPE